MEAARRSLKTNVMSSSYRLHDLVIDVGRARVTRGGAKVALPKISFALLVALMGAAPNLVSIDDLMNRTRPFATG